jgi:hypothetical protein
MFLSAHSRKFSVYFPPHCDRTFHRVKNLGRILVFITVRLIWSNMHFWAVTAFWLVDIGNTNLSFKK